MEYKGLPLYDVVLGEGDIGVSDIALVENPAIEIGWLALSDESEDIFLAEQDLQELWGPILVPGKPIIRKDVMGKGPCYIRFTEEQIKIIADKFNKDSDTNALKFTHQGSRIENAYIASNWVINPKMGLNSPVGLNLDKGSWFGRIKIEDTNFWKKEIKNGKLTGFSVEINASLIDATLEAEDPYKILYEKLTDKLTDILKKL